MWPEQVCLFIIILFPGILAASSCNSFFNLHCQTWNIARHVFIMVLFQGPWLPPLSTASSIIILTRHSVTVLLAWVRHKCTCHFSTSAHCTCIREQITVILCSIWSTNLCTCIVRLSCYSFRNELEHSPLLEALVFRSCNGDSSNIQWERRKNQVNIIYVQHSKNFPTNQWPLSQIISIFQISSAEEFYTNDAECMLFKG